MKDVRIGLSLKKFALLIIWMFVFLKINFGIIRSNGFLILLENNQILLNSIIILIVYLSCRQGVKSVTKRTKYGSNEKGRSNYHCSNFN